MRRFLFVLVFLGLFSCNFFESKEKRTQELIDSELRQIDWNSVDSYPLFLDCDETAAKDLQRACFEQRLTHHFRAALNNFEFIVDSDENPTIAVIFVIDAEGDIDILEIEKDAYILKQMPEFDGIVSRSLKTVPEIVPALKRGVPVSTKFRIHIQLSTK